MNKNIVIRFVTYWATNIILLSLAYSLYPNAFELGNKNVGVVCAAIFSSFLLTTLLFIARGLARTRNILTRGRVFMFFYYWGSASFAIWIVARIADVSGFGIARYTWAVSLGFVISFIHWCVRQSFKGMKLVQTSN